MFVALVAQAQELHFLRSDCLPSPAAASKPWGVPAARRLPDVKTLWDSTRVYPIAVVLVSYADTDFAHPDCAVRYDSIFNRTGYNEGKGPGCVADYFVDQSAGLFHPRFDIYGPVKVGGAKNSYGSYGSTLYTEALGLLADQGPLDFTPYDWDGNKSAEFIIYVFAGYGGNESATEGMSFIIPNTGTHNTVTIGGVKVNGYSASAELWSNDKSCGVGTICHEFCHTLGLPDLYPVGSDEYSVVDEWDLMDGGNFINNGWCPPNLSAYEKMLLGWLQPEELTQPVTIDSLKPVEHGGKAFLIKTDEDKEYFLVENRQWSGWDLRVPGHGLLVAHVDYSASAWNNNRVNSQQAHHRYDYVHADNMSYTQWANLIGPNTNPYKNNHSRLLSGTPYPLMDGEEVLNDSLTENSVPPFAIYADPGVLRKPLSQIVEHKDGTISFCFMEAQSSGLKSATVSGASLRNTDVYDFSGRKVLPGKRGFAVRKGKKIYL